MDRKLARRSLQHAEASLTLHLDEFAYRTIEEESVKLGVSVEEFAIFGVLYYLADIDSGRIARRMPNPDADG